MVNEEEKSVIKPVIAILKSETVKKLGTQQENTWCPGCPNFVILDSVKQVVAKFIDEGKYKQEDFAITTDIGCHAKIFDYLNLSGIYCLHGRAIPTAIGMKLGNPNLKVLTFAGDGAAYSEGISHFIHAFKYNPDMTLVLHDNQSFSLTTGQPTPTSQQGFLSKSEPLGVFDKPINPLKLALASNATFIARVNARDIKHMNEIFAKAINHKGFSFVEVIQDCLIFNLDANHKDKMMYKIEDNTDLSLAEKLVGEFDYNSKEGKIPIGVIYQNEKIPSLEEKWPQLKSLMEKGVGWKGKDL
ncbi:MAG: thiamine pyrophosphate-dependent enzyme [archaeon]|nr:thiamine pyrophosphate-dependent enzyme [archaeon]MCR4323714.1 thiamine pyrophosphate-dependent enzyme [Nanoarchaeota archaeon]